MEAHSATEPFSFEGRLSRSKSRDVRDQVAQARVTNAEYGELLGAAKKDGRALGEWCREVLLSAARGETVTPVFTEIVAIRQLLNATMRKVACGKAMNDEEFQKELQSIRLTKHKAAAEMMQQYAIKEEAR